MFVTNSMLCSGDPDLIKHRKGLFKLFKTASELFSSKSRQRFTSRHPD